MKKHLIALTCFILLGGSRCVLGDAPPTYGLTLTAVAGDQQVTPTPNSPIWIDLTVKNTGASSFDGGDHSRFGNGAIATTSPVTNAVRQRCINGCLSGGADDLVLDAGKTQVFHVMLNGLLPAIQPGISSGWIVLPLYVQGVSRWEDFTLVAPFRIKVGRALTPDELTDASNILIKNITAGGREVHFEALQSINALPDHYAVQTLATLFAKSAPNAGNYVDLLGYRPRTSDDIKALQDIAQSNYPALSAQAKGYLTQASDNKTP